MADDESQDQELGFWDHVEELRRRVIRSVIYVAVAGCAAWFYRTTLLTLLQYPALEGARRAGLEDFAFRIFEAAGGFLLMIQVAMVAGIVLASPLLTFELWGFIEPALLPHEKRWAVWAIPAATLLFLLGVATCYWIAPTAFAFFLRFNLTIGVQPELTLGPYLYFLLRLVVVFGVLFELPLFLMILAAVGVVSSAGLIHQWRLAIVTVFLVAAIATPTGDALTMSVLAAPMMVLYVLSVFLVRLVEKRRRSEEESPSEGGGPADSQGPPVPTGDGGAAPEAPAVDEQQAPGLTELAEDEPTPAWDDGAEADLEETYRQLNEDVPPALDP